MKEISESKFYFKPMVNFLPMNLDLDNWLQSVKLEGFKNFNKDNCAQLISSLYTIPLYNKKQLDIHQADERVYCSLSSKTMYSYTKDYRKYVDLLLDTKIWESDNTFEVGSKSIGYRFTPAYYNQPCKKYLNYRFGKTVDENQPMSEKVGFEEHSYVVNKLISFLGDINLDYQASIQQLQNDFDSGKLNVAKYNYAFCALEKIQNKEYFAKQDEYGRLHTNITNLKKEYRNYLSAKGQKLVSLDLKNSQPFFSTLLFKSAFWQGKNGEGKITLDSLKPSIIQSIPNIHSIIIFTKSVEDNEDVLNYIDLVVKGSLYEFFLGELVSAGLNYKNRKEAKQEMFKIFFSRTVYLKNSKSAILFQKLFPNVFKLFNLIKTSNHNTLALLLQGIESEVFIERVAGNFINKFADCPLFTIHDSFLVPLSRAIPLKRLMRDYMTETVGYRPSIEAELLK